MKKDNLKMSYAYICLEIMKTNIYTLFSQLYTHIRKSYSFRFRISYLFCGCSHFLALQGYPKQGPSETIEISIFIEITFRLLW